MRVVQEAAAVRYSHAERQSCLQALLLEASSHHFWKPPLTIVAGHPDGAAISRRRHVLPSVVHGRCRPLLDAWPVELAPRHAIVKGSVQVAACHAQHARQHGAGVEIGGQALQGAVMRGAHGAGRREYSLHHSIHSSQQLCLYK